MGARNQRVSPAITLSPSSKRDWFRWGVGLFILCGCLFFLDLTEVMAALRKLEPAWLVLLLFLMTADRMAMAWKWTLLLRARGVRLPFSQITRYYYQGTLTGLFMPSSIGGDLLRAHWVSEASGVKHPVYASLVMEKILGLLSSVNWGILGGVIFASVQLDHSPLLWIAGGLGTAVCVNGVFLVSLRPEFHASVLRRLKQRQSRVLGFFHRLYESYSEFSRVRGVLVLNFVLTALEQLLQMGVILLIALSLEIDVDPFLFLVATAVQILAYRLPVAPDGWGVAEVAAIGVYGLIGMSPESAFTLAIVTHVLQTVVVLPGFWFIWRRNDRANSDSPPSTHPAAGGNPTT